MTSVQMPDADGASAPSIATFLATPRTQPGGVLSGEVRLKGGDADALIDRIGLGLAASTRPVRENGDHSPREEFSQVQISGAVILRPGKEEAIAISTWSPSRRCLRSRGSCRRLRDCLIICRGRRRT
ncbi:sporulation protein [Nonomuraea purpurea]|uniref:Sporulation protein n=1 Tax=Nonomuraea purpurea TaxID=1849276 RepID=A0ABV8GPM7_9ACTN